MGGSEKGIISPGVSEYVFDDVDASRVGVDRDEELDGTSGTVGNSPSFCFLLAYTFPNLRVSPPTVSVSNSVSVTSSADFTLDMGQGVTPTVTTLPLLFSFSLLILSISGELPKGDVTSND
jgi:hypothetical protein